MGNEAVRVTSSRLEELLGKSHAFRRVDNHFYVVRQGSAYVYIHVVPWKEERALVRFVAQLAGGVDMTPDLALRLLRLNASLRFGSFGWVNDGSCVTMQHTLLGAENLDEEEILGALRDFAILADEFDDRVVAEAGGKTMQTLLAEHELTRLRDAVAGDLDWGGARKS
jgi:type III secretion system-like peptide-binding chaperone